MFLFMAKPKQLKNNSTNSSSSKLLLIIKLHYLKKNVFSRFYMRRLLDGLSSLFLKCGRKTIHTDCVCRK